MALFGLLPLPVAEAPFIDTSGSPQLVRCGRPVAFTVRVRGDPPPAVTWYVNEQRVSTADDRFRMDSDGCGRHTLQVLAASELLDGGVWVVATNDAGQDSTAIIVKTYRVLSSIGKGYRPGRAASTILRGSLRRKRRDVISDSGSGPAVRRTVHSFTMPRHQTRQSYDTRVVTSVVSRAYQLTSDDFDSVDSASTKHRLPDQSQQRFLSRAATARLIKRAIDAGADEVSTISAPSISLDPPDSPVSYKWQLMKSPLLKRPDDRNTSSDSGSAADNKENELRKSKKKEKKKRKKKIPKKKKVPTATLR